MSSEQWIYGGFILAFTSIGYLFIRVNKLAKTEDALPLINTKLDNLKLTLDQFLKNEIETLKDIAKSNKERNEREIDND